MVNLKRMLVRLGILKRRDPEEYSKTEFIEQNRVHWERFIDVNLKKSLREHYLFLVKGY